MAERQVAAVQQAKSDTDSYIREVAGKSPAEHIADAKALLDAGTIDQNEFNQLKAKRSPDRLLRAGTAQVRRRRVYSSPVFCR